MEQPIVNFILGRLSVLSDDELANLDFESALAAMNDGLSDSEKQQLNRIFTSIQSELGVRHYGVKGMRWGVRRYQNKDGSLTEAGKRRAADANAKTSIFGTAKKYSIQTRSGESISVEPLKPPSIGRKIWDALMGTSNTEMGTRGDANYTLSDSSGNKVGQLSLISKSSDVAYIDWITVDEKHRGKGYATDVINDLITKARESGYSRIELNALKKPRPLYERLGFTYQDRSNVNIITRISEFELGTKRMVYELNTAIENNSHELMHYGVKGMKWGVRRKRSGPLTDKQIKKYAKKGYAQDSFRSNKTVGGKLWDAYTGAHKTQAGIKYDMSSKKQNRERAEQYLKDKEKSRKAPTRQKVAKAAAKGAKATANALAKVGNAYVTDQLFFGGMGTEMTKAAVKAVGMATITAATMARGGYDIKWYDKQGRRVG